MGDGGQVFVTVGTTSFDKLISVIDTLEFRTAIKQRGYSSLLIQLGRGSYLPIKSSEEETGLSVDYFTFSPNLQEHMKSASLIISHAGSGSIFEALRLGKPLVVVVNDALMDNHQAELAEELASHKYLYFASPDTLIQTITGMDLTNLVPYEASNPSTLVKSLDSFLGVNL